MKDLDLALTARCKLSDIKYDADKIQDILDGKEDQGWPEANVRNLRRKVKAMKAACDYVDRYASLVAEHYGVTEDDE